MNSTSTLLSIENGEGRIDYNAFHKFISSLFIVKILVH